MKDRFTLLRYGGVISNSALTRKNYGMDNSNRTSRYNVGHSIGSSGKTFEKLQDKGILEQEYKED